MMLYPNSAGTSPLTVLTDQIIGVVRYIDATISESGSSQMETGELSKRSVRGTSLSLKWRDLSYEPAPSDGSHRTRPQILRLKHKLAALQRSAEELFVC